MNTSADMSIFKNGRFGISSKYDVQVVSSGFDNKDRRLLDCWQVPEDVVIKILDLYGNAANHVSICRCPDHKEEDNE